MRSPALERFNLNLFFAFDAIVNTRTLTEAARKTNLTQPALSLSLKKLRQFFNDELIVYSKGGAQLTPLAQGLRPRIRQILQASREAVEFAPTFEPSLNEGSVIVTMPGVIEVIVLDKLMKCLLREAPLMRVVSVPFVPQPALRMFQQALDVAVVSESMADAGLSQAPMYVDSISCMVWDESRYGDVLTEAEFFDAAHVNVSSVHELPRHPAGMALRAMSERQTTIVRASNYTVLPHLVIGTDVIATTLTSYARRCAAILPVRVLPVPFDLPEMPFVAQWQRYRDDDPSLLWLIDTLKQAMPD